MALRPKLSHVAGATGRPTRSIGQRRIDRIHAMKGSYRRDFRVRTLADSCRVSVPLRPSSSAFAAFVAPVDEVLFPSET